MWCVFFLSSSRWGSAPSAMSLRTSARAPVRGRGRVVRRGARGGTSGWAIGSRVVPATAVPEELVNQVSQLFVYQCQFIWMRSTCNISFFFRRLKLFFKASHELLLSESCREQYVSSTISCFAFPCFCFMQK